MQIYKLFSHWLPAKPHFIHCLIFTHGDRIHVFSAAPPHLPPETSSAVTAHSKHTQDCLPLLSVCVSLSTPTPPPSPRKSLDRVNPVQGRRVGSQGFLSRFSQSAGEWCSRLRGQPSPTSDLSWTSGLGPCSVRLLRASWGGHLGAASSPCVPLPLVSRFPGAWGSQTSGPSSPGRVRATSPADKHKQRARPRPHRHPPPPCPCT